MTTVQAQISNSRGHWRLYVALLNASEWPERRWTPGGPVPTPTERDEALATLGYEPVPGTRWRWCEDSAIPDDPTSPVWLIASATVRLCGYAPPVAGTDGSELDPWEVAA
ncbi:DUF6303 family protein [Streptomyces sp. NPDC088258]|uniref:DUF6303 family protein n=1 Tax=Streptomyces sp. NPDC088258 TaxID=3365849 RepID=UPI00381E75B4